MNELKAALKSGHAASVIEWAQAARAGTEPTSQDAEALWQRSGDAWQKVCVISLGNSLEDHGPALAPDIDDRLAQAVSQRVCQLTGARYIGHSPSCTDGLYPLARRWSPIVVEPRVFVDATFDAADTLLRTVYDEPGLPRPRSLFLISGHGGNGCARAQLEGLGERLGLSSCRYFLALMVPEELRHDVPPQHAAEAEHAVGAALGCLDVASLEELNARLAASEASLLATLARFPTIGGMAGYYLLGDRAFDEVRARYSTAGSLAHSPLKRSVELLLGRRKIEASEKLGRRLIEHAARTIANQVAVELS